jgi:hypothetical protein
VTAHPSPQRKVYLHLSAQMQREIRAPLADILRGQGVALPQGVDLSEESLPAEPGDVQSKDWGTVLSAAPDLLLSLGGGASAVILALSKYLKDRERVPKVLEVWEVIEVTGPDGKPRRVLVQQPKLVEPGPERSLSLEALLEKGKDLLVRFKADS